VAKKADWIRMPFRVVSGVGRWTDVLDGDVRNRRIGERLFWGGDELFPTFIGEDLLVRALWADSSRCIDELQLSQIAGCCCDSWALSAHNKPSTTVSATSSTGATSAVGSAIVEQSIHTRSTTLAVFSFTDSLLFNFAL